MASQQNGAGIFTVDTSYTGYEHTRSSARYNTIGTATSENVINGAQTVITQGSSTYRDNVVTINDADGFVVTDDKVTFTPMQSLSVTTDGGTRELVKLNTDSYETISIGTVVGGCSNTQYTTETACENVGVWAAGSCSVPGPTDQQVARTMGGVGFGSCSISAGRQSSNQLALLPLRYGPTATRLSLWETPSRMLMAPRQDLCAQPQHLAP